jgi:hypothetical protein
VAAIAEARRAIVTGRNSRSASAACNAATVAGSAGIGWSTRAAHHARTRASRAQYACLAAGAAAEAA